ncbi:hypothetical protein TKK_0013682 [Trichogramma kaykai]
MVCQGAMLKLVRNALLSRNIIDGEGKIILWDYIRKLVDLQYKEGLHLATKIKRRHVKPFNEKMKVCLAAQVLSRSVAAALETCEIELQLDQFENASATAKFCRIIDDCFDLLNS